MNDRRPRALLIGNWEYADPDQQLKVLRGPKHDLEILHSALTHEQFGIFAPEDVTVRSNLTSGQMAEELLTAVQSSPRSDLLIYYTGHAGKLINDRLGLYGIQTKFSTRTASAFPTRDLSEWIDQFRKGAGTVIILDCCYAGAYKGGTPAGVLEESFGTGTAVLASAGNQETPDALDDGSASPFTDALVRLLLAEDLPTAQQGFVDPDDIFNALLNVVPRLLPPPQKSGSTSGRLRLARRAIPETAGAGLDDELVSYSDQAFDVIDLFFDEGGCRTTDGARADLSRLDRNRQAAVRRLSSLADAVMRSKGFGGDEWGQRAVRKTWHTIGTNLFESALPDTVQDRLRERVLPAGARGDVLKLRLNFTDPPGRSLEPYPWEYLQVADDSDLPERNTDLPLPLSLRSGILIERVSTQAQDPPRAAADAGSSKPAVGLINALPAPMSDLGRRTGDELSAMNGMDLVFQLHDTDATWRKFTGSLDQLPRHLVLFVPITRDDGKAQLGFFDDARGGTDWRDVDRLVTELAERPSVPESLVLVTFASSPGTDTVRGVFEVARDLTEQAHAPVVFACHWPGFEDSVQGLGPSGTETFAGLLLQALAAGKTLDNSVYYARTRIMKQYQARFEKLFGLPGYYAAETRRPERTQRSTAGVRSAVVSPKEKK